jgi:fructose-specific phosphotransferase system component IIB
LLSGVAVKAGVAVKNELRGCLGVVNVVTSQALEFAIDHSYLSIAADGGKVFGERAAKWRIVRLRFRGRLHSEK